METRGIAIELRDLAKAYGSCVANAGVSLKVEAGTIHGIIGENGAGKSTAMKMLYGMTHPDSGEIIVNGQARHWRGPRDAIAAGIGMVHQHFMLAGPHTALDNIILGAEPKKGLGIFSQVDRTQARKDLQKISEQYGLKVDLDAPVETLSVGVQQRIEILKLLYRHAQILILDEPTAVLTPQETTELLDNMKKLKAEGKTILIITHKLTEVMSFTDNVTVFRAGRVSGETSTSKTNPEELAQLMVGRKVLLSLSHEKREVKAAYAQAKPVLEIKDLTLVDQDRKILDQISLKVRPGEVVGIAGVEGNGQTELIQAILHPTRKECRTSGQVALLDQDVSECKTSQIRDLGLGLIPQDRHHEGLMLNQTVEDNFLFGLHRSKEFSVRRLGAKWIKRSVLKNRAAKALKDYDVRPARLDIMAKGLSGGNQQKLIIAREFERNPKVLIAAQPTRGVDVGAIESIHQRILQARDSGVGVLLISSELEEVLSLSDRVLVIYEGKITAEFSRDQANEREIGFCMGGGKKS